MRALYRYYDQREAVITWQQPGSELGPQHGRVSGQNRASQPEAVPHQPHLSPVLASTESEGILIVTQQR